MHLLKNVNGRQDLISAENVIGEENTEQLKEFSFSHLYAERPHIAPHET